MSRDWRNQFPSRRGIFLAGGAIAFAGLAARLAELQLFRSAEFQTKASENQIRLIPAPPHRGTIYDRTGRPLATSKRNFYVQLRPEQIRPPHKVADVIDALSGVLMLTEAKKRSLLQEATTQAGFLDILVADDLTWEQFSKINVMAPELEGVSAEVGELRSYPLQSAFYHTVGYVKKADEKDIMRIVQKEMEKAGKSPDSPEGKDHIAAIRRLYKSPVMRVGKAGIEAFGEEKLKGEPGKNRVLQNANGRVIEELDSKEPGMPGTDVVLSLDAELQKFAIQRFGREPGADPDHPGAAGSAVMIDVATGEVLVMMSTPAPDPNLFVSGIPNGPYDALKADVRNPLYHKAYEGIYPPGSTFKIVVATAALESGAMKPEDRVYCAGKAWYYTRDYACWRPEGHGSVNLHDALKKSCDCYFYAAAQRTGIEKIAEVAKKFGIGHRYELGLTGGKSGVAPNNEWKLNNPRIKERWYPGDTISVAIGQGYVEATPFEMAVMASRIAGGHATPNPHLVVSGFDVPDQTITSLGDISEKTLELVRAGMKAVTTEPNGTAFGYLAGGVLDPNNELPAPYTGARMAGKSGTAQVRKIEASERNARGEAIKNDKFRWELRDHAHFVAYAPTDKPRYAIAITVEHGVSGSGVAAPIARDILAMALRTDPGGRKPFQPNKLAGASEQAKPT